MKLILLFLVLTPCFINSEPIGNLNKFFVNINERIDKPNNNNKPFDALFGQILNRQDFEIITQYCFGCWSNSDFSG